MAECKNCRIGVGCSCNLINGLCKSCYATFKNNPSKVQAKSCSMTIPKLNMILASLDKKPDDKIRSYQKAIVKSQIQQFDSDPCKFESIISNIQL